MHLGPKSGIALRKNHLYIHDMCVCVHTHTFIHDEKKHVFILKKLKKCSLIYILEKVLSLISYANQHIYPTTTQISTSTLAQFPSVHTCTTPPTHTVPHHFFWHNHNHQRNCSPSMVTRHPPSLIRRHPLQLTSHRSNLPHRRPATLAAIRCVPFPWF